MSKGKLYIVSTPIGNPDDISKRAENSIKRSDKLICEEFKEGAKLLKNMSLTKEMITFNEHSNYEDLIEIVNDLKEGKKYALVSDCGTPLLADPGYELVHSCIANNVEIEVVPGASSILTALVSSGFRADEFSFAGFLGRTDQDRENKLKELSKERRTIILLETPYRLIKFLESAEKVLPNREAYIGMNLTMPFETHHRGTFTELHNKFKNEKIKAEFVICFEGFYR